MAVKSFLVHSGLLLTIHRIKNMKRTLIASLLYVLCA
jgi:hypothetical protein